MRLLTIWTLAAAAAATRDVPAPVAIGLQLLTNGTVAAVRLPNAFGPDAQIAVDLDAAHACFDSKSGELLREVRGVPREVCVPLRTVLPLVFTAPADVPNETRQALAASGLDIVVHDARTLEDGEATELRMNFKMDVVRSFSTTPT